MEKPSIDILGQLKRCEVFVGLADSDLQKITSLPSWQRKSYNTGEYIFHEDTAANHLYILEDGQVDLLKSRIEPPDKPAQVHIDIVTKGDIFGWSALIRPHVRTMSAICIKPSSVLLIDGVELIELMKNSDSLGYEVMQGVASVISSRLRKLSDKLTADTKPLSHKKM